MSRLSYLRLVAMFVRDLLDVDESTIKIGRLNHLRPDFETDFITIDNLGVATRLDANGYYDGSAEKMMQSQHWESAVTVSFFGDSAPDLSTEFCMKLLSQAAIDLQTDLELQVNPAYQMVDLSETLGKTFQTRIEVMINIVYSLTNESDIRRVDLAVFDDLTVNL